jgi:hypothetical protein
MLRGLPLATCALLLTQLAAGQEQSARLAPGTEIKLTLLRTLESGKSKVGSIVPFIVMEDVKDSQGRLCIAKGSYAVGTVTASRGEGALSAPLLDKPARLAIRFDHVYDVDGNEVPLVSQAGKPKEVLALSRDDTAQEFKQAVAIKELLEDKDTKEVLEKLVGALDDGQFQPTEAERAVLEKALAKLDMPVTNELVKGGKLPQLFAFCKQLGESKSLKALTSGSSLQIMATSLQAMGEIVNLSNKGVRYVKGRLKGRNIRAYPGCSFTAYVGKMSG